MDRYNDARWQAIGRSKRERCTIDICRRRRSDRREEVHYYTKLPSEPLPVGDVLVRSVSYGARLEEVRDGQLQ